MLFPTRYEACSYVVLEALASGVPLVTTTAGWMGEFLAGCPAYAPLIVTPDVPSVASTLSRLNRLPLDAALQGRPRTRRQRQQPGRLRLKLDVARVEAGVRVRHLRNSLYAQPLMSRGRAGLRRSRPGRRGRLGRLDRAQLTAAHLGVALIGAIACCDGPRLTIFALLILCQELDPSGASESGGSGLLFLGHQVYFTTFSRVSLLTLIAVIAWARVRW